MHAAQHRALRELHAFARQLARHWRELGHRLGGEEGDVLAAGAAEAESVVGELSAATAARGVYGAPAAALAGRMAAPRFPVPDRLLERNQALRLAVLDVQHCVTLLGYLVALARSDGDQELAALCAGWEQRLAAHERAARAAAVGLGGRPAEAIAPADPSPAGRAGQRLGAAVGAAGEWVDRRAARRGD
jgi:hypothetical protein